MKRISIIAAMYNEEDVVDIFFKTIIPILETSKMDYEIICINDGSKDNTLNKLLEWHNINNNIKIINFSRNFGKESAMTAGIDYATGDALIPIDCDLQDPPELILEMIKKWQEGFDIVNAVRKDRSSDTFLKRKTSNMFYSCINKISDISIPNNVGDYRLLSKRAYVHLKNLKEKRRFMKGLYSWIGFSTTNVYYSRQERVAGTTKWNYWKLWNFAIEGITSFSTLPLKIATYLGVCSALFSFIYAIYLIISTIFLGNDVKGYPSMMVIILMLGGVQLIFIGIIGEYISRIHDEVKNRPIYITESVVGFKFD